jgi:hypothetical protein
VRIVPYQSFLEGFLFYYKKIYIKFIYLVDTSVESETSGTDLWSPTSPESGGATSTSSFDFSSPSSPLSSDLDNNNDSTFTENFFIDEKYLIIGDKLGRLKVHFNQILISKKINSFC